MKTKQTKIDRPAAKWLPGAMALAATTASSQAATVQITLTGNKISTTGNQLVADLTGDNVDDLVFRDQFKSGYVWVNIKENRPFVGSGNVFAYFNAGGANNFKVDARFANEVGAGIAEDKFLNSTPQSISYLNAIRFTDSRINGGQLTDGWLQVNAFNTSSSNHTVELSRLIFDDASRTRPSFASIPGAQTEWEVSAVPEASTSLGLLALGAGGILTRRRTKRAA